MKRMQWIPLCLLLLSSLLLGADWPQWQGPDRTNISTEKGLLSTWPEGGPPLLWTFEDAGVGYSGPAVVGNRLYLMGGRGDTEFLFSLSVQNGQEVWFQEIGPLYKDGRGDGPRGTPTVDGELTYGMGGQGDLLCVKTATGEKVWSKSLTKDLGGRVPGWGYSSSPLVDGDKLVCIPGGRQGCLAALNKKTGEVIWRSKDFTDGAQYASLRISEAGGVRQYVVLTSRNIAGIAAKDGALLWKFARRSPTAACATPIVSGDHVYVSTGYNRGCTLIKLARAGEGFKAEEVYDNTIMVNHHGGVLLLDGHVYGYSDRGGWTCQEFLTGKAVWQERKLAKGSLTCADGKLYCYGEREGNVVLAEASPRGWTEHGRFRIPKPQRRGRIWTHPVVANGRLYLRDQELLWCYDVKAR
jgi:outer membrane protein assembly factor BamB